MEKLRELLNEFDPYIAKDGEHRDNLWYGAICGESAIFTKEIGIQKIISKEYEFIKQLVKNNKIDRHNVGYSTMLGQLSDYHGLDGEQELLMILAIQDNPIEFLISVLK